MTQKIVGVFASEQDATDAIQNLKDIGYRADDISVIGKNKADMNAIHDETGTKAPEGVAAGAATGGVLGGVAGLLAGLGALAIPGIGPIVAAGPIAATLTGAAVGAGTGGLVGGLVGLGIPEDQAKEYDSDVKSGRILVMVDADDTQENRVYTIFRNHNSLNAKYYNDTNVDADSQLKRDSIDMEKTTDTREPAFYQEIATMDRPVDTLNNETDQERTMRLREEQLDISKRQQTTGEVNLRKEVVEHEQTINVPVNREEVVIEKKAVQDQSTGEPIGHDETIRIPVKEEQVEVNKRPVVTGEVEIHKRQVQDTEEVRDTLKKEEAHLEQTGNATIKGDKNL
ncbi:YsnF/AvaK domain-containing protein [Paenibacillus sp. SAF-054]|uniref:YsnF/AvaK domain-containing protein n=1 Tax=unclassified Paenibacillus TaxID=185978 RepID=UPI003F7E046C